MKVMKQKLFILGLFLLCAGQMWAMEEAPRPSRTAETHDAQQAAVNNVQQNQAQQAQLRPNAVNLINGLVRDDATRFEQMDTAWARTEPLGLPTAAQQLEVERAPAQKAADKFQLARHAELVSVVKQREDDARQEGRRIGRVEGSVGGAFVGVIGCYAYSKIPVKRTMNATATLGGAAMNSLGKSSLRKAATTLAGLNRTTKCILGAVTIVVAVVAIGWKLGWWSGRSRPSQPHQP